MQTIHLINPLVDPFGGSENRVLELHRLLRDQAKLRVWSQEGLHPELGRRLDARLIEPRLLRLPLAGRFVFIGAYYRFGNWLRLTRPQDICVLLNTPEVDKLHRAMERLAAMGLAGKVRVAYASRWLRDAAGWPGEVLPSPIDLGRFRPSPRLPGAQNLLTIGRLSRDAEDKHHPEDPSLYRRWAQMGHRIRVMGGTCLASPQLRHPNIELLACGAETPEQFLRSLDVFFYRTHPRWREPSGRVVSEAMATGLAVICDKRGGYVEAMADGQEGLLFEETPDALAVMEQVAADPALRQRLGRGARARAEHDYSEESMGAMARWLLGPIGGGPSALRGSPAPGSRQV